MPSSPSETETAPALDHFAEGGPVAHRPSASLSDSSGKLVEQLTAEVQLLRAVQHRLEHDDLSQVEMRQVLGQLFVGGSETLGTARAFHESIRRLELSDTMVTPSALMGDENVLASLAAILDAMESASKLVAADLSSVEALVSILEENLRTRAGVEPTDFAALEIIRALASNAVGRLDLARPPHDDAEAIGNLRRLVELFAAAPGFPPSAEQADVTGPADQPSGFRIETSSP